jgi:hypothetical protein
VRSPHGLRPPAQPSVSLGRQTSASMVPPLAHCGHRGRSFKDGVAALSHLLVFGEPNNPQSASLKSEAVVSPDLQEFMPGSRVAGSSHKLPVLADEMREDLTSCGPAMKVSPGGPSSDPVSPRLDVRSFPPSHPTAGPPNTGDKLRSSEVDHASSASSPCSTASPSDGVSSRRIDVRHTHFSFAGSASRALHEQDVPEIVSRRLEPEQHGLLRPTTEEVRNSIRVKA